MTLPVSSSARALTTGAAAPQESAQYLTFSLGKEMFAIGILNIREILEYGEVTAVPMMPAFIRGVINLRGAVVPVVDLAARFGGGASATTKRTCIVIVEVSAGDVRQEIGVIVDAVSAVIEIPPADIEPAPAFGAHMRPEFIAGMGKIDGRFVIILDVGEVLSVDDLVLVAQAAAPPEEGGGE